VKVPAGEESIALNSQRARVYLREKRSSPGEVLSTIVYAWGRTVYVREMKILSSGVNLSFFDASLTSWKAGNIRKRSLHWLRELPWFDIACFNPYSHAIVLDDGRPPRCFSAKIWRTPAATRRNTFRDSLPLAHSLVASALKSALRDGYEGVFPSTIVIVVAYMPPTAHAMTLRRLGAPTHSKTRLVFLDARSSSEDEIGTVRPRESNQDKATSVGN
jgi:hypothetical protein